MDKKILYLFTFLLFILLSGCASQKRLSTPVVYGTKPVETKAVNQTEKEKSDTTKAEVLTQGESEKNDGQESSRPEQDNPEELNDYSKLLQESRFDTKEEEEQHNPTHEHNYAKMDTDDSASAVDDFIWRQFDLIQEYHAMGVIANREASWEEAQYYFEKSLKILAVLDIETDSSKTPEALKYSSLLDDIISDYRVTLRSLGKLTEEVSSAVIIERFGDLVERLGSDSMMIFTQETGRKVKYDIPIVINDRVKRSIVYFQTVAKEAFKKYLRRSEKYTPMMRKILKEYGLPEDLIYLSLVESGYNPNAYSWARAVGLWQFISSTGRLYKLNRNWWYDERRDPVKATHAACKFLGHLYKKFGSWDLAMAAYNGGPGRVSRTIKKQKTNDFWKLRLKRQTMDYVPLIMAATIIAKEPEKYGFANIEKEPEVVWDEVEINRCLDLNIVAREINSSISELKTLNPELLRRYTPPNVKKYLLKIPKGSKTKFLVAYENMPSPKETSWVKHKIRRGETISTIAARYGVSQYAILQANNLSRRSTIYAGKKIVVPVPLDRSYSGYSKKKDYDSYKSNKSVYSVRSGDTMWDIANAFGTTVSALRRINYIERGSRIYVGQKLKIPSSAKKLKSKNSKKSKSPKAYASKPKSSKEKYAKTYKVRSGDTLWDIARKFGTTTSKIRSFNGLGRSSRIYPGQILKLNASLSSGGYVVYKVKRGDTLGKIARRYRTTIAKLMATNGLTDPNEIIIGTRLKIY